MQNKTQAQLIADVNLLHMQKKITDGERSRQIFQIRAEYEKKVEEVLSKQLPK